jgi:ABC-2 type transport system ATP-binding protein
LPESLVERKANELLRLLWLHEHRHSPISSYSKGMKQRVLIGAALLHDPDLLIFDEPLSGLDIASALLLHEIIAELARQGKTIMYISHVLEVTEKVCSRVIMLYQGKVVANDEVGRLRELMQLPSLEQIFRQLARQEDVGAAARAIVAVMREA